MRNETPVPSINLQICIGCGVCVAVCPERIIGISDQGVAEIIATSCMACSHCFCVCPEEAISVPWPSGVLGLKTIDEKRCGERRKNISAEGLVGLMRSRRSCRVFKDRAVEMPLLNDLVRIGATAPSGTNSQGWQFVVLPERGDVLRLGESVAGFYRRLNIKAANPFWRFFARLCAGNALSHYYDNYYHTVEVALREWEEKGSDRLFHGAPSVIVVTGDESSSCPQEDAMLATQNILLAAEACGIGTCLIGYVVEAARRDRNIKALLKLGPKEHIYSVIACGYPAVRFRRFAGRRVIKPKVIRLSDRNEDGNSDKGGNNGWRR